jgi:hypothetical protein
MGLAGERRVKRLFTWDRVVAAIERLYFDVLQPAKVEAPVMAAPLSLSGSPLISEVLT